MKFLYAIALSFPVMLMVFLVLYPDVKPAAYFKKDGSPVEMDEDVEE